MIAACFGRLKVALGVYPARFRDTMLRTESAESQATQRANFMTDERSDPGPSSPAAPSGVPGGASSPLSAESWTCPTPLAYHDTVQLAHGGGGRLMRALIGQLLLPQFAAHGGTGGRPPRPPHDSAVFELGGARLAFTTDSFVVSPLFFPGGDVGKLAVYGTVNDLAMAGATPQVLSCGLILEEGLPLETLRRIVASMQQAAEEVGVQIVTGDTKVVDRGKRRRGCSSTRPAWAWSRPASTFRRRGVAAGDRILISGDIGRHGIAIMSVREGLQFEGALASDCASLAGLVSELTALGTDLHCLRDLTRGGLAAALIEIAEDARGGSPSGRSGHPGHAAGGRRLRAIGLGPTVRGQRRTPDRHRGRGGLPSGPWPSCGGMRLRRSPS